MLNNITSASTTEDAATLMVKTCGGATTHHNKVASWKLPPIFAFAGTIFAFVGLTFAAGAPSPLFVLFQKEWHFPAWVLTVAFAIYAITLLVTILITGSFSDYLGRRPILISALLTEAVSMLLFVFANDISWIIVARAIQGIATGAATSAFTAAIVELAPPQHKKLGALIGSTAPIGGLALGAIVTGFAIQFSQTPSLLIFSFLSVIFGLGTIVVYFSTETVPHRPETLRSLRPHLSIPAPARREFVASSLVLIATWMLAGLYFGLGPSILRGIFQLDSGMVNGLLVAVPPTFGVIASLAMGRFSTRRVIILGVTMALMGAGLTTSSVIGQWFLLLLVGAGFSGAGFGSAFSGVLRRLGPLALPSRRAELFAGVYLVSYLAYGLPALVAGVMIGVVGLLSTVIGYGLLTILAALFGLVAQLLLARTR